MNTRRTFFAFPRAGVLLWALGSLLSMVELAAVAVSPPTGTTGVAPNQKVVFYFGFPMDESQTVVSFVTSTGSGLPVSTAWTFGYTVLTCSPIGSWPSGSTVLYSVDGVDILGDADSGSGYFKTSGSSGGGGSGTNAITDFVVQAIQFYNQTNTAAPILDPEMGYTFGAIVSLASNRTATAIGLTPPTGVPLALTQSSVAPEDFFLQDFTSDPTYFNTTYPAGSYAFLVEAASSNQTVTLTLSPLDQQPNAPHLANFAEAQQVNPSQPFTLHWDAFTGGTAADYVSAEIGTSDFYSPDPGEAGALNGTSRAVVIPANTLQPSTTYAGYLTFYRSSLTTNTTYSTASIRATQTAFSLITTDGSASGPIQLVNSTVLPDGSFRFQIQSAPGQAMDVQMSATLDPGSWSSVLTTNSETGVVEFTVGPRPAGENRFYRVQGL